MSEKLRILVTGFEPFPGAPFNPTQPLVARLRADASIRARVKKTEAEVADGRITPAVAAEQIAEMLN